MSEVRANLFSMFVLVLLMGCSSSPAIPDSVDSSAEEITSTLSPTSTPLPSATAVPPTPTPTPTPTIEPPTILSEYLVDVRVAEISGFDTLSGWNTYNSQTGFLADGVYTITGQPDWGSGLVRASRFAEGEGLLFDFKFERGTEFEFILEAGQYEASSYRRFGVFYFDYPEANLTQGVNAIGYRRLFGNFQPRPDTWYSYMSGIGLEGEFIAIIWDPANPSNVIWYREKMGEAWNGLFWEFTAKTGYPGMNLQIDNYAKISFSAIK